ncbi:hypothetical protein C491_20956 [Natronococcus amylolyticus DSM 10524]|uniref:DUF8139 domain-containing protein n=1 Tax=Natronococcus amylolyticus DSM 10524 TaxID=1227497 RepID=L9WVW9_9EURY|nr:hypothetical protein C491_20956 [Natronococcus amylolyticus DSM 10524]
MQQFKVDDRVRIDIPDETDPDYRLHGEHGTIAKILSDDAAELTGNPRDSQLYRIELDSGQTIDMRWRSLRPPIED